MAREVTIKWYTPEEKNPEPYKFVAAIVSGDSGSIAWNHALELAVWDPESGWDLENSDFDPTADGTRLTVHEWSDLEIDQFCGFIKRKEGE